MPALAQGAFVFISYSHENESHNLRVRAMAVELEERGFSVFLDHQHEHAPASWFALVESKFREADTVLCVCTPTYCERFEEALPGGQGRGVSQEAALIRNEVTDLNMRADRFLVVHMDGTVEAVPALLRTAVVPLFRWPFERETLVRALSRPRLRRRLIDTLALAFDRNVDALVDWAARHLELGRNTILDFEDRARRVADLLLRVKEPRALRAALRELARRSPASQAMLEAISQQLKLGSLSSVAQRHGRPTSRTKTAGDGSRARLSLHRGVPSTSTERGGARSPELVAHGGSSGQPDAATAPTFRRPPHFVHLVAKPDEPIASALPSALYSALADFGPDLEGVLPSTIYLYYPPLAYLRGDGEHFPIASICTPSLGSMHVSLRRQLGSAGFEALSRSPARLSPHQKDDLFHSLAQALSGSFSLAIAVPRRRLDGCLDSPKVAYHILHNLLLMPLLQRHYRMRTGTVSVRLFDGRGRTRRLVREASQRLKIAKSMTKAFRGGGSKYTASVIDATDDERHGVHAARFVAWATSQQYDRHNDRWLRILESGR